MTPVLYVGHPCISAYNFQSGTGHISDGVLGGFWYSLPTAGECKATHDVGTDGCTMAFPPTFFSDIVSDTADTS